MLGLLGMLGGVFSNSPFWQGLAGSRQGQALTLPLTFRQAGGSLTSGFSERSRRLFDTARRVVDLANALQDPAAQQSKARGSMQIGALSAAHVQGFENHHVSQRPHLTFVPAVAGGIR